VPGAGLWGEQVPSPRFPLSYWRRSGRTGLGLGPRPGGPTYYDPFTCITLLSLLYDLLKKFLSPFSFMLLSFFFFFFLEREKEKGKREKRGENNIQYS